MLPLSKKGAAGLFFRTPATLTALLIAGFSPLEGGVIVNDPLPITHQLRVQPIIAKKENGTRATFMGNASTEAYVKGEIARVWAQSGVAIQWEPAVEFVDDFTYDGSPADYSSSSRPQSDLAAIDSATDPSPPKHPDEFVINMYFVEIVPGFPAVSEDTANGLATLDRNRCVIQIGENLLNWTGGQDLAASVIAHEIGHNLGLSHLSSGQANMMSPSGTSDQLNAEQTIEIFNDDWGIDSAQFLQAISQESNYTKWAQLYGVSGGPEGDHDRDRIANVIEFMLGLSGTTADNLPPMEWTANGLTWRLPKNADALDDGLNYRIEVSTDAQTWYQAGTAALPNTVLTDDDDELSVRLDAGASRAFMRFSVDLPPDLETSSESLAPPKAVLLFQAQPTPKFSRWARGSRDCKTVHPVIKK